MQIDIPNMLVLFGPPGTGKTSELSRLVRQYAQEEGSDSLLLCSYTQAGARELAGRDLPLGEGQIGTLHSHCFRGLDSPRIAESTWKAWNEAYPQFLLGPQGDRLRFSPEEMPGRHESLAGGELLHEINLLRSRLIPPSQWYGAVQGFWRLWGGWKADHGLLDFTDLLERALQLLPVAPGRPSTIIVDEAQDLSLLMWTLIQSWARQATRVIVAGDDDQAVYRWVGGDFRPLLACADKQVLPQSYRVPQAVQVYAEQFTRQILTREPKQWAARPGEGSCEDILAPWDQPSYVVTHIEAWMEDAPWDTYMCIAPCGYMLEPLIALLRAEGIPFSNRWRRSNYAWNPLAPPAKGVSTSQRLKDFLRPPDRLWTWPELLTWVPLLHSEACLTRGAKASLASHADETGLCPLPTLATLFQPDALQGALTGGIPWLEQALLQTKATQLAYPLRIYKRWGLAAFEEEPHLTVGTCHSLKGAEAHRVALWPTLSRSQHAAQRNGGDEADDVLRMLYVGATRAKEQLLVCAPLR